MIAALPLQEKDGRVRLKPAVYLNLVLNAIMSLGPCGGGTRKSRLTSEDLVEEDLDVVRGERLRRHDHFVEVALHQLCYHVAAGR